MSQGDPPILAPPRRPLGDILVLLALLVAAIGLVHAFWPGAGSDASTLSVIAEGAATRERGPYAGSKVCAECHAGEVSHHTRSGHGSTLHLAADFPLAKQLDGRSIADPEREGVAWSYAIREGKLEARRSGPGRSDVETFVLEYVFGSGRHAATFLTLTDSREPRALEHRMTYFAADESIGITPGQSARRPAVGTDPSRGRALSSRETLKCFGCHATPAYTVLATEPGLAPLPDPGPLTANVTCERCHGPARAHLAAARRGQKDLTMPFGLRPVPASVELGLCGQCHRHPARFPADRIRADDPELARFQPIGHSQSKCYTASRGNFRCTTCHDPHARSSSEPAHYETACLGCHGGKDQVACRVSPIGGCLGCHMPKVDSGQKILFTDHWIRPRAPRPSAAVEEAVSREGEPTTPASAASDTGSARDPRE